MSEPLVLTVPEAAKALAISRRQLRRLTNEPNGIPCVRLGRSVRYRPADLSRWLEEQRGGDSNGEK